MVGNVNSDQALTQAGGAEVVVVVVVAVAVDAMEVASANRGRSNTIIDKVVWNEWQSDRLLRKAK